MSDARTGQKPLDGWLAHAGIASASAGLLALAYPWPGWGWLAHGALVPVGWLAVTSRRPGRVLAVVYAAWLAWWLTRIGWIAGVTVGGYLAFSAYLALYAPAALLLARRLAAAGMPALVGLPLAWASAEHVRRTVLAGGFGWLSLAQSQAPAEVGEGVGLLVQCADLFGESGVTLLVGATNGLLVDLLRIRRPTPRAAGLVAGWAAVIGAGLGYGAWRRAAFPADAAGGPAVAVVQTDVPQRVKNWPTDADRRALWRELAALTRAAAKAQPEPEVVVWPETAVLTPLNAQAVRAWGPGSPPARRRRAVEKLVGRIGIPLIAGGWAHVDWRAVRGPDGRRVKRPRRRYNAAYLFVPTADGARVRGRYDKVHRVPFGEYVPWVGRWPALKAWVIRALTPYDFDYTLDAGARPRALAWPGGPPVATPICFEDTVPRVTRRLVRSPAGPRRVAALFNLSNEGWFVGTAEKRQHLQQAALRCIEHRVPMARSVNTGISAFIDPAGRIGPAVREAGRVAGVSGVASARLARPGGVTGYGLLGNAPAWVLVGATLLAARPWRRSLDRRRTGG